ncbi:MAG: hypothetical protein LW636_04820 [Planctomycetaceae bacterium]|jgi:DNA-directed RNA polymerase specialized sigma24 family protein|nr:hypothetical protein [Planctomycetaceae bacterium]
MTTRATPSMTQTNWDLIRDAASGSETAKRSLESVARRAWPAIFAFIRASGRSPEEATDLTQGFIADVFLSRGLLEKADPARGRFRTLLIGAVRNYLADMHRRRTAGTRMPKGGLAAFDDAVEGAVHDRNHRDDSPERAFNTRYVAGLIRAAAERLQQQLLAEHDSATWELFRVRVLQASFEGAAAGYDTLAPQLGLSKGECAGRLVVAKRRFATLLLDEVRATVGSDDDARQEIIELMTLLSQR